MKTKLLLLFLLIPLSLFSSILEVNKDKRVPSIENINWSRTIKSKSLFIPSMTINEFEGSLIITFQFYLENSSIKILDDKGNTIIYDNNQLIYNGKTILFHGTNADSYSIEIISTDIIINAEITFDY